MNAKEKQKVITLKSQGLGYRTIAKEAGLSVDSVKSYLRRSKELFEESFCEYCGRIVTQTPHRKKKRFCSDLCRRRWWDEHPEAKRPQKLYSHVCAGCGAVFETQRPGSVYCSRRCFDNTRRKAASEDE